MHLDAASTSNNSVDLHVANALQSHEQLKFSGLLYEDLESTSDSSSSDIHLNMARSLVISDARTMDRMLYSMKTLNPVAYVDSGADTCIAGVGWIPLAYTNRKANLVGYDERSTKKSGLDICTVATKIITHGSLPDFILVAHETVYNPGSQVSLISEFQVREHGCVVDCLQIPPSFHPR